MVQALKTREKDDQFTSAILLNKSRSNRDREDDWRQRFSEVMEIAVGMVGLLHDVGHPPFSHVLEDPYNHHSDKIFPGGFLDGYREELKVSPDTQFHEYASGHIVHEILKDSVLSARLPVLLVEAIFDARGDEGTGPEWAKCVHQLIDGQIDVDRLDYISRDSLRAGTNYHAIDHSRLIGNLENFIGRGGPNGSLSWTIGLGIRGISAMESLLLQREQSYRWMIFHPKALIADTALKRIFFDSIENSSTLPNLIT